MTAVRLLARQIRFTNRAFWRDAAAAFFTFVFPLMLLAIFAALFGSGEIAVAPGRTVSVAVYYVPGIAAFSVITACYTHLAMAVTAHREEGVLKRLRGTPLPAWAYLAGRIVHAVLIALLLVAICLAFGAVFYQADLPTRTLPAFLLTIAVGAAAFSALGLAVTAAIPSFDAASPIVNASVLPLMFVSDVFIPLQDPPAWLDVVGKIFPVRHFAEAMQASYFALEGSGFRWGNLAVVAAWGLLGLAVAIRTFRWESAR